MRIKNTRCSLHVLGGRAAPIAKGTLESAGRLKKKYSLHAPITEIWDYHRLKDRDSEDNNSPGQVISELHDKRIREGCGDISTHLFESLEEMVDVFVRNARTSLAKGETPIFLAAANYKWDKRRTLPDPTTFFEEVTIDNVHAELDKIEAVIGRTTSSGSEMERRLKTLRSNYHGIQQLARAFRAHPDQETLQQALYLIITNPTSITTMLFAEESGINPERIMGPSDVDRTRYVDEIGKIAGISDLSVDLRRKMGGVLEAFGPHNPLNGATRSSVRRALTIFEREHYSVDIPDFEVWYKHVTRRVNDFGTKSRAQGGEVCRDTIGGIEGIGGIIGLLQLLFPFDPVEVKRKSGYFPERMKAQVYDPTRGMYVGSMVEKNTHPITQGERIRATLRDDLVLPALYTSKHVVVVDERDKTDFDAGNLFTRAVLEEMKAEGLISLTVNDGAIDARHEVENPAAVPSIRSRVRRGVDEGAYIAVGVNDRTRKVGLFKKVDDGIEMRWSRGIQVTPRSFAYDSERRKLLVGTKDGVLAYALNGRSVREAMHLPNNTSQGRPTGVTSIVVHEDCLFATVPGVGIVRSRNYSASPKTEVVLPVTDQYVGALGFFDNGEVGVSIGAGIFRGEMSALSGDVQKLHEMSGYRQLGGEHGDKFSFDAWIEHDSILYAITHDGVLVKWSPDGLPEVLSTPAPLEQLVEGRARVDPRFVVRERTKYRGESTAYCPNSLGKHDNGIIAVRAGENNNEIIMSVGSGLLTIPDYNSPSHRLVTPLNGRLLGIAPRAYNLMGVMRFVDEIPSGRKRSTQTLEPIGFGVCEVQIT